MKMQLPQRVLLTFNGLQDPYSKNSADGPILTLLSKKNIFDRIALFYTTDMEVKAVETKNIIQSRYSILVTLHALSSDDPSNYEALLKSLRPHIRELCGSETPSEFFISVSSGSPQMHACWLLLAASGEIPAHILHIRDPKHINQPSITEINPRSREFPRILTNITMEEIPDVSADDMDAALRESGIVGSHPKIKKALEDVAMASQYNTSILILGESGTGKELLARFIHNVSKRREKPFFPLNCGAIPESLVEGELFGHMKGAFTGAIQDKKGCFDVADGGTLFLDEIGNMPMQSQTKLLRILQEGMVTPIGATESHKVNVRIIAATNLDLEKAIGARRFREDLYFRLSVIKTELPPLRERRSDIPMIALHILDKFNTNLQKSKQLTQDALIRLQNHYWTGNIRELRNVIERAVVTSRKDVIGAADLELSNPITKTDQLAFLPDPHEGFLIEECLAKIRSELILKALELAEGNQSKAARFLGISPQAISKFLKK